MKIIKDLQQGTQEWRNLRLGKITGSNFDRVITRTGNYAEKASTTLAYELASEIFLNYTEETYKSSDMIRGTELEPDARALYEENMLVNVEQVAFIDCGNYGCSPDGLVGVDGAIEIKCPKAITHFKYIKNDCIPDEYYAQCQGVLMCSERKWLDFVSYHPDVKEEHRLFIKRVERDEEFIANLKLFINLTIDKINNFLCLNNNSEINSDDSYEINEISDNVQNSTIEKVIKIEDENFNANIEKYINLENAAEEFSKLKKMITSQAEAIHLANDVFCIESGEYKIKISYSQPKIHTEKTIAKKISSATEDLEEALNLEIGKQIGEPKFKCEIIKNDK